MVLPKLRSDFMVLNSLFGWNLKHEAPFKYLHVKIKLYPCYKQYLVDGIAYACANQGT